MQCMHFGMLFNDTLKTILEWSFFYTAYQSGLKFMKLSKTEAFYHIAVIFSLIGVWNLNKLIHLNFNSLHPIRSFYQMYQNQDHLLYISFSFVVT